MALECQAALEQAVVNAILAANLGYQSGQVGRTFDDRPPPSCGEVYVGVWSEGRRESRSRSCLDETLYVNVTVTRRCPRVPFDRLVSVRDDVEARLNRVRALVHSDVYGHSILNAASVLASLETDTVPDNTKHVGFREALWFQGYDELRTVPGDYFHAGKSGEPLAGMIQTARFGGARRVQALQSMA